MRSSPPVEQTAPPSARSLSHLRPADVRGAGHTLFAIGLTGTALFLSASGSIPVWLAGQVLLSLAFLLWFTVLHEAGHKTLFKTQRLNRLVGHGAGVLALIPFHNWRLVHARHHRWTGWHDLDPTTSTTLPRPLPRTERLLVNACWFCWIPLFSLVYRVQNYWWLPRLWKQFAQPRQRRLLIGSTAFSIACYSVLILALGPVRALSLFGLALYLSFAFQDVLILSQHSHIPMNNSEGQAVTPFTPVEQEVFTRSLAFPRWFSSLFLLNFDAHELHHMYPAVPGYHLAAIDYQPENEVAWWRWVLLAKRVRGDQLIFQNRTETGWDI